MKDDCRQFIGEALWHPNTERVNDRGEFSGPSLDSRPSLAGGASKSLHRDQRRPQAGLCVAGRVLEICAALCMSPRKPTPPLRGVYGAGR